jgi:hypothetical protein
MSNLLPLFVFNIFIAYLQGAEHCKNLQQKPNFPALKNLIGSLDEPYTIIFEHEH